ncbi:MAG: PAS domain S-box protein [Methylobacter sp.]|uniref:PAS domain S-box protein n=1 Tax=Methylobacter sp. TaxID=2051955 RepID=UPI002731068D|nr:PAS domain S-box protein [Methylobacter sp.]MDP1667373.1 PAS domain S-box protein [Methylobacter sp.]
MKAAYKIVVSLAGAALLAALVAIWFGAFRQIEDAAEARKHTYTLIIRANALLSELKDAETGHRIYSLTGDEAFLEPYLAARNSIIGDLQALRQLTFVSAAQKHLDALTPLADAELAEMSQVIELRRHHGTTAVPATVDGGQGKHLMDSMRAGMGSFIKLEEDALAQHDAEFQSNMRHLFTIIVTSSLFVLLSVLVFAYFIYSKTQQRLKRLVNLETQHLLDLQEESNRQLQQVSEEKLAVTLNSIGDAVMATDAEARVTLMNPLAEQLTGWTQAEAIGRSVDEIFHIISQETRQPAAIPVMETLAHGTIQGLANHTVLIARDGSECDIADSCAPIRDRGGQVIGAVLVFRDVTEEYAAQQALNDSAALIQTILNTVVDGIITLHARGGIIETVNPAAEQMFGYTAAELIGQHFSMLIPELDRDQRNGSLEYYSASDEARAIGLGREVVGQRKDGSMFPMEMAVSEMRLGGQRYFTGILRDSTARKQSEAALLKAGALQNAIFNSANFSSIATDAKGVIQIFNVGAEHMLGYAAADVMNKITPADISDPQEVIARAKALSEELSTSITPGFEALVFKASRGIEDIYELTYIRKDGSRFPAVVSVTALRDDQDAIIGYLLIGTDNSARKQVEEQLRWTEESFRLMVESVTDYAIVMLNPEGCVVSWNSGAQRIKGYSTEEIVGQHFSRFYPHEDIERGTPQRDLDVVTAKGRFEDEGWRVRKNGSTFWANVVYTAIRDQSGNLRGFAKLTRDLTERKRLDQVLQEKNAELENAKSVAEKANLAKSDFLSSMSHELRTPLNAILGFAQLLEAGLPPPTAAQIVRLHHIIKAGWYLLDLINEILDLALIESGKLSLSREPVSLIDVILECQAMIEPQAQQHDVKLTFLPFDTTWFAYADRTRVKQVLINLLSNAIKYNREHGTVEVKCTESTPECIRISIKDSGAGLSPDKLAQLFQPFNRLGQETGTEEGTGIGLVVTKQLVELMGGTIGVDSTVGAGSEFWIDLIRDVSPQFAAGHIMPAELVPQAQENAALRTLLYVEDNPANLMLVEQIIESHPHVRMLSARNGNLGIALAHAHLPDVILMDINLPGISGIQALKILREDPVTAHIPVIALSANAMPRDIERGLEAGFFRYLTKPIKINEFMKALDDALKFSETELTRVNETGQIQ